MQKECYEDSCTKEEMIEALPASEIKALMDSRGQTKQQVIDTEYMKLRYRCNYQPCDPSGTEVCVQDWMKRHCTCQSLKK